MNLKKLYTVLMGVALAAATAPAASAAECVIAPADGEVVNSLSEVTFTFPDNETVEVANSLMMTVTYETTDLVLDVDYTVATSGNVLTFTMTPERTEAGYYTVAIQSGSGIKLDGVAGSRRESYMACIQVLPVTATVFPENGAVASIVDAVGVSFPEGTSIEVADPSLIILDDEQAEVAVEGSVLSVVLAEPLTAVGEHYFMLSAGAIKVNGELFESELFTVFTIFPDYTWTVAPAAGSELESFSSITITFEGIDNITNQRGADPATLVNNATGEITELTQSSDGPTLTLSADNTVATEGSYSVVIPAELFYLVYGSGRNATRVLWEGTTIDYTISNPNYTGAAEIVRQADSWVDFTVSFYPEPEAISIDYFVDGGVKLINESGQSIEAYSYEVNEDGKTAHIAFDGSIWDIITQYGVSYTIDVLDNVFVVDGKKVPAFQKTFMFGGKYYVECAPDPDGGKLVNPEEFVIEFSGDFVEVEHERSTFTPTLECVDADLNVIATVATSYTFSGTTLTIKPTGVYSVSGTYRINIPAGSLLFTTENSPYWNNSQPIIINYDIVAANLSLARTDNVTYNLSIYPTPTELTVVDGAATELLDGNGAVVATSTAMTVTEAKEVDITFAESAIALLDDGRCSVRVPAGALDIDGAPSPEIVESFRVSGIDAIVAGSADGTATVYSLSGVLLLQKADRATLSTLPKGIYVINGEKTLVK